MTADQLVRCILERAIADGLVLPATDRFSDANPQKRTYAEVQGLAKMVVRWQKGQYVQFNAREGNIRYG
jgi:hypothetical protein